METRYAELTEGRRRPTSSAEGAMQVEVIEYELACTECGTHRTIVPLEAPRPTRCVHCFRPITRKEIRRDRMDGPLSTTVGSEAWIG